MKNSTLNMIQGPFKYYVMPNGGAGGIVKCYDVLHNRNVMVYHCYITQD